MQPLPRRLGGMCSHKNLKGGELLTPLNLPPSGTQSAGEASANEGGKIMIPSQFWDNPFGLAHLFCPHLHAIISLAI